MIFYVLRRKMKLNALNKMHDRIIFTCELEERGTINFLDLTIVRSAKTIKTGF